MTIGFDGAGGATSGGAAAATLEIGGDTEGEPVAPAGTGGGKGVTIPFSLTGGERNQLNGLSRLIVPVFSPTGAVGASTGFAVFATTGGAV